MTKRTQQWHKWVQMPLAAAIAVGLSSPATAFNFRVGDVDGAFDTRLTAAVGWRTQSQDSDLIGQANLDDPNVEFGSTKGASSTNYDDGNLNFDRGDTYSKIIRGSSELYLNQNFRGQYLDRVGGFVRGRYWYDFKIKDQDFTRDGRATISEDGKDNASGGELLDAYVWTDWYVNDVPVSVRYGRQVFNWGESTFIQGGINSTNPVDVGAIRSPGSELREALLPVEALYVSAGLTDSLTVEGYLQYDWEPTQIEDCGTFFSSNDFVADGCGPVFLGDNPVTNELLTEADALETQPFIDQPATIEREGDRRPDADNQYGIGLQWYSPELGETEFGAYHVRYHSRLPYVSGRVSEQPDAQSADFQLPTYFIDYPEDIKLYGVSMNTNLPGGWSLGAEYSFRENMPLQWNAFELIDGGLQNPDSLLTQKRLGVDSASEAQDVIDAGDGLEGERVEGWDTFKVSQAQATFIKFFDRIMGASRMTFIGEVGMTYVHDLPSKSDGVFGRSGNYGRRGDFPGCEQGANSNPDNCTMEGFVTTSAWGYRTVFEWEYPNAFMGANLKPRVAFNHDVRGNAPEPGGAFSEGEKAISLGLTADYQDTYQYRVQYTNFFGGDFNQLADRDHITASVSYAF